ncbi:MAG TPA: ABC transporter permease [Bacillales bacterium]|nr:ABC transporter permease [Bacillales bacterium]
MTNQHMFLQLVKQDLIKRKRRRLIPRQWWMAYLAMILLIAIAAATYVAMRGNMDFHKMWFFASALPIVALGITAGQTAREWKNHTIGWWLSLPISRGMLIASKFCAGLIRAVTVLIIAYLAISLFGLYMVCLAGQFQADAYLLFLTKGVEWFALLICTFPFMAALGQLFTIIKNTLARPVLPLLWGLLFLIWGLGSSTFSNFFTIDETTRISLSVSIFYPIAASWIAAFMMICLSAYLLDRHVSL